MLLLRLLFQTGLYIATTVVIVAISLYIKFVAELIGDEIVYKIPLLGDLLLSIEIIEILNVLVFAILGLGFGVATILLPRSFSNRVSYLLLLTLVPCIYSSSVFFKYQIWVQSFSINENISYSQAQKMTNTFLRYKTQNESILGFYLYTANFPVIPAKEKEMVETDELMNNTYQRIAYVFAYANELLQKKYFTPTKIDSLFKWRGWILRVFYFLVSMFTAIVNFKTGLNTVRRS
ncbi:hypothetical protein H6G72_03135 [Planktothricoides sp. FACHB-1370]|uniref:Uncharacterized protein n=2 Tax=Oscillatoriaceae TaxID=1892254 RepID=A0ABR8EB72_9CYAN|nr:hypothetical protein [Planktothricoides raciborskii]MBD2542866.1 hypothetical protein [Planktothricoides raciborskii FACHB-1370]MBD2581387.1 hypothetical protein [Planktothricoides raciborskii FACHB-1261]